MRRISNACMRTSSIVVGVSSILFFGFGSALVHAQDYGLEETAGKLGYDRTQTVYSILGTVTTGVLATVAFIFFGLTMYAGLRWLTSRGNQEFVDKAKSTLTAAIIGLVVTLGAYGLTTFIFSKLQTAPDPNKELLEATTGPTVAQPDSCFNQVKDGLETDFNCGGSCDAKCAIGRFCNQGKDCQSNNCLNGVCTAGGTVGAGQKCSDPSECVSGTCVLNTTKGYTTCGGF